MLTINDCKFADTCGGGHTTAQHYLHVHERVIEGSCGYAVYAELLRVVNEHAEGKNAND